MSGIIGHFNSGTSIPASDLYNRAVTGQMSRSPTFLKIGGSAAEGAIVYMGGLPKEKMPGFASHATRYKARFGEDPITYSPYSYDGTMALLRSSARIRASAAPSRASALRCQIALRHAIGHGCCAHASYVAIPPQAESEGRQS